MTPITKCVVPHLRAPPNQQPGGQSARKPPPPRRSGNIQGRRHPATLPTRRCSQKREKRPRSGPHGKRDQWPTGRPFLRASYRTSFYAHDPPPGGMRGPQTYPRRLRVAMKTRGLPRGNCTRKRFRRSAPKTSACKPVSRIRAHGSVLDWRSSRRDFLGAAKSKMRARDPPPQHRRRLKGPRRRNATTPNLKGLAFW